MNAQTEKEMSTHAAGETFLHSNIETIKHAFLFIDLLEINNLHYARFIEGRARKITGKSGRIGTVE